ncbi:hypothetical protein AB7W24_22530 [Providencia rettgeri]
MEIDDIFKEMEKIQSTEKKQLTIAANTYLYMEDEIEKIFKTRIENDVHYIMTTYTYPKIMAYFSAAIKNYKRHIITLCVQKIQKEQDLKLSSRSADMFFIAYLGRSVNEIYLCENFKTDYIKRSEKYKTLTPAYKEHLKKIIYLYKDRVLTLLNYVIDLYRKIKSNYKQQ